MDILFICMDHIVQIYTLFIKFLCSDSWKWLDQDMEFVQGKKWSNRVASFGPNFTCSSITANVLKMPSLFQ